jgi:hypothetical protein
MHTTVTTDKLLCCSNLQGYELAQNGYCSRDALASNLDLQELRIVVPIPQPHMLVISQGFQEMYEASEVPDIGVKSNSSLHLTSLRICIYIISCQQSPLPRGLDNSRFSCFFGFKYRIPAEIMFTPGGYYFTISTAFEENGFSPWTR